MLKARWARYYWRWFSQSFNGAWKWIGPPSGIAALAIRYLQEQHPDWVPFVSHWVWVSAFWVLASVLPIRFLFVPYLLHEEDVPPSQRELEIVFEENDKDYFWDYQNNGANIRLYKVGVRNKGKVTVRGPNLRLVSMSPRPSAFYDFPLHQMHGKSWGLNPGVIEFFDVIQMSDESDNNISVYPNQMPDGIKFFDFPKGEYILGLQADGVDTAPVEKYFTVNIDSKGKLSLRLAMSKP